MLYRWIFYIKSFLYSTANEDKLVSDIVSSEHLSEEEEQNDLPSKFITSGKNN